MLYLLNHFLWFFLPGALFLHVIGMRRAFFLLAFASSYSLMMLNLLTLIYLQAHPSWFSRILYIELSILLLASIVKAARHFRENAALLLLRIRRRAPSLAIVLLLIAAFGAYWHYAGPYAEIPADAWAHLHRMQAMMARITNAEAFWTNANIVTLVSSQDLHWYFIATWLCRQSGMAVEAAFGHIMLANSITFMLGIFSFGMLAFRKWRFSRTIKAWMAAAATFFCFAHLGVMVFSYFRYYALSPAILNHLVFLAALAIWIIFLEGAWRDALLLLFLPLFAVVMVSVHTQEALFTAVVIPPVSLAAAVAALYRTRDWRDEVFLKSISAFCLAATVWCAGFLWLRHTRIPSGNYLHYLGSISDYLPFLKRGMILNPYYALEVIMFWGLFVYLLFLLKIKVFMKSPLIAGGMLIPFLTYFNPAFIDILLRYHLSGASVVYRMGYAVPLAFVAGSAAVMSICSLTHPPEQDGVWKRVTGRVWNVLIPAALIMLLFPLWPGMLRQSRLPTLRKVPGENSPALWADLCSFLQTIPPRNVVADPITEYVVGGLTHHRVSTRKFDEFTVVRLRIASPDTPLSDVFRYIEPDRAWLAIVNRRDGGMSAVGAYSLHWPADVLKVSAYYPEVFVEYLDNRPEVFIKIWEQDSISVYDVNLGKGSGGLQESI